MVHFRKRRVAEQIQEEISNLLLKDLKDPRIGFITITGVEVSSDLSQALVYFCSTGAQELQQQSLLGLQSAAGFVRKTLGKRLHIKTVPEIHFKYDTSLDRGARVNQLLAKVREKEGWDDPTRIRGSAEEVAHALMMGKTFLLTSHTNPDGDAIASILAMGHLIEALGKKAMRYQPDPVPMNFRFLPGTDTIRTEPGEGPYDTTIVMDCSELNRIGPLPLPERHGKLVGIDHHLTTMPIGEVHYLDPGASSIGEMIDRILEHLPVKLDLELATCIYCSILSDTGSFRYSNTTPTTFITAAKMISQGVSPWDLALKVYESQPLGRLRLLASVLQTIQVDHRGRYGSIVVTRKMLEETSTTEDMIDGFINYPRSIEGVDVAIQFREIDVDQYKVSFRSQGRINVAAIAERFGGGGHMNAAGCSLAGSLEQVRNQVYQTVEETLDE